MQAASVKQTRSVCSERARTPAGGRSRCGFAKQIRGFSAQSHGPKQMRCRSGVCSRFQPVNGSPAPRRIELCAGRAFICGNCIPESVLRLGRSFRMTPQAESPSRNRHSERDTVSRWPPKRKPHPGICAQNGTRLPPHSQLQNPCALHSKTG